MCAVQHARTVCMSVDVAAQVRTYAVGSIYTLLTVCKDTIAAAAAPVAL
jgi:hypothetical protein